MPLLGLEPFIFKLGVLMYLVHDWLLHIMMPLLDGVAFNAELLHHLPASELDGFRHSALAPLVLEVSAQRVVSFVVSLSRLLGLQSLSYLSGVVLFHNGGLSAVDAGLGSKHFLNHA